MIVVIPTNREVNLDYLSPLIDAGARFIIVADCEESIPVHHPQFEVYSWQDRRRMLGKLDVGIPRRNGACRDFGFYVAWKNSDDDEIIIALDDDCMVYHSDFAEQVSRCLSNEPRPMVRTEGSHLNIIDLYNGAPDHLFPRGFPYSARAGYERCQYGETVRRKVKFSLGLWKEVFDVNAIDKLNGPEYSHPDIELTHPSVALETGPLVSVCSMNMHFRRELVPAVYQVPMHVEVLPGWVIDRYGDIWGGFILKTLMDIRGDVMAVGEPMVRHLKEGNGQRNIWQEHICHLVNEEFLELLDRAKEIVQPGDYLEMMSTLNEGFRAATTSSSPLLRPYMEHLTQAIDFWLKILAG